jgi:hypothetical protein
MTIVRFLTALMLSAAMVFLAGADTASAQETSEDRSVSIEFDVGDHDAAQGDWPITVVRVSGDLDVGELFVVELRDSAGAVLWAGQAEYRSPTTSVTVDRFIAVGDVEEAAIGQRMPTTTLPPEQPEPVEPGEASDMIEESEPDDVDDPDVAGDVVTIPPPLSGDLFDQAIAQASPTPGVRGDMVTQPNPDVVQQGSGLSGAGQLALSMVVAVVFVAILFRTPLPAATTQRWRK